MKKILITGINSYIGTSFEKWVLKESNKYLVDTVDVKNSSWKSADFSKYDVVFHVAGIAHVSTKRKLKDLYYKINRDLTVEVAKKARAENVKQFIFMSSIIVYGKVENGVIKRETIPIPDNYYGESKLQAEERLFSLQSNSFNVVVLRSPMIYGKNSKGNYYKLLKLAKTLPIFPDFKNRKSMLYIDNLCNFISLMIDNEEKGLFFPQNKEYVCTSNMVNIIANLYGNKVYMTKIFNSLIRMLCRYNIMVYKVFGNNYYDIHLSNYKIDYITVNFNQSIELSIGQKG